MFEPVNDTPKELVVTDEMREVVKEIMGDTTDKSAIDDISNGIDASAKDLNQAICNVYYELGQTTGKITKIDNVDDLREYVGDQVTTIINEMSNIEDIKNDMERYVNDLDDLI